MPCSPPSNACCLQPSRTSASHPWKSTQSAPPGARAYARAPERLHACMCACVCVWLSGCLAVSSLSLTICPFSLSLSLSHSLTLSHDLSLSRSFSLSPSVSSLSLSVLLTFLRLCKALLISRLQHALVKVCGANTKGCSESVLACRCTHACACMRVHDTDTAFEP